MILISALFVKINTSICIVSRIKFYDYDYVLLQYHKPGSNARSFSCQRICGHSKSGKLDQKIIKYFCTYDMK